MSDEIEMPNEALERNESLEHASEHEKAAVAGAKRHASKVTLLILLLAMAAAIAGKMSAETEIHYLTAEIELTDTWAQYQGKSDRQAIAQGFARLASVLPNQADPAIQSVIHGFNANAARLEFDDKGEGKEQLAEKAKALSVTRDRLAHRMEGFSISVVLLAVCIGLGSASMLTKSSRSSLTFATVAAVVGIGAALYGLMVGAGAF